MILERIAYRPLRKRNAPRLAFLISAIGMSLFLQELVAVKLFGHTAIGRMPSGDLRPRQATRCSSASTPTSASTRSSSSWSAVLMMVALDQFVSRTRLGRGIRAVAQDTETARLMGVNIDRSSC